MAGTGIEVRAVARNIRISPQKVRLVLKVIEHKPVNEAEAILRYLPHKAAGPIAKLLKSAVANADNNFELDPTDLVNTVDGSSLAFTPIAPATITLTNSGAPGSDFGIGGSIEIPSTADGTYSGNVTVTAEYQ